MNHVSFVSYSPSQWRKTEGHVSPKGQGHQRSRMRQKSKTEERREKQRVKVND